MRSLQLRLAFAVSFAALTACASIAQAEVWRDVFRGMSLFDYQFNGERNLLGNGWDITANAVYSGQEYDFGFAELTLASPVAPVVSNIAMGYTLRGLPKAEFSWNTGGRALPYTLEFNNGIQDLTTINGSILVDVSTDVNILGFYDTRIQISNRGQYSTDGFLTDDDGSLAFDVGPIDISGNIYADMLAAITAPLWSATNTPNPFAKFSEKATKTAAMNATADELRARIEAGQILSDDEMATLVNSTLIAAILGGDASQGNFFQSFMPSDVKQESNTLRMVSTIPEPATLLLLLGLGTLMTRRRCRR